MVRYHELKRLLTVPTAQSWRLVVLGLRHRAHQLGECNKYAELNRLMGTLANVTLGLYVILNVGTVLQRRAKCYCAWSCWATSLYWQGERT